MIFSCGDNFKNKKVLVMGLGIQGGGSGVARFFSEHGAQVTVTDLKPANQLRPSLDLLKDLPIKYVLGKHRKKDFLEADLVMRNPDVPQNSPFLKKAREHGVEVEMDESLFMKLCPVPVIGVTGTRGKTTTVTLIGEIFKKMGFPLLLGGNLRGVATLSLLEQITFQSKVVLELSSWQLQGCGWNRLSPHIAVVTNIYPDHLNRYKNMKDYIADKEIIFKYQTKNDFLILNRENKMGKNFAKIAKAKIIWFSKEDLPPLILNSIKIPGEHNRENVAAAVAVAKIFKISDFIIKKAVEGFSGLPHRLEKVRVVAGVTYINDSTSTMPTAAIAALRAIPGPIILICGGASKKLDLTSFAKEIGKRVKAVVLLEGTATGDLEKAIQQFSNSAIQNLGRFNDFKKAVLVAKENATLGETILLSPGCTSFGMFQNEFDRGEQFKKIVGKL